MERIHNRALIIVDVQRGFMPATEGERLHAEGFGELGVNGGELIVDKINQLSERFADRTYPIATTQDYHPAQTAHFSQEPNYINTWPVHCVGGTPGAELHPGLRVVNDIDAEHFIKGDTTCTSPEEDTSYTGALAYQPTTGTTLPQWLREQEVTDIYVTGLALGDGGDNKLCVDSTAADLLSQGFDVTLITDATEAVFSKNRELCFRQLGLRGIRMATTAAILQELGE
ncbi:MAG: isochorismatase hydrolase, nicotinamidase/pyrazinamidase [Candidatus Saccharibacteria bacterium]|nr:isochorismatase hydrolase, nicotinamidase/pyrazinamidase [Candidatus Saccharibacteria bacterium]